MRTTGRWAAVLAAMALALPACAAADEGTDAAAPGETTTTAPSTATSGAPATTSTTSAADALAAGECPLVPPPAVPSADRPQYVVEANVDPVAGTVDGTVQVQFTPDLDIDRLVFRLWPNGPRSATAGTRLDVGPVTSPGGPLPSERPDPTTLVVPLPRELPPGATVEVGLPWHLEVPNSAPDRLSHDGDSLRLGSFFPMLAWEPGVGWATEPPTSGYAEASTAPIADFDMTVTVPAESTIIGTGRVGGGGHWRVEAVRDVAIAVGRFTTVTAEADAPDPVTVTVGVAPGVEDDPQAYANAAVEALEDFGTRFGGYPWADLTLSITPGLPGGIEYPATIFHGPDTVDHVAHEVAHQWFYAYVGNDQGRDPWLDEGLASWAQTRIGVPPIEELPQPVPADAVGRAGQPMAWWEDHLASYYRGVYVQPALALHELGDPELVDCALAHYVADQAYRVATPAALFQALGAVFPDAEEVLAPFGLTP